MANNGKNLQKRLLAYSAAAVVATAGAAAAMPGMALETNGVNDNDFDIVLDSRKMSAAAQAATSSACLYSAPPGTASISMNVSGYNASAFVPSFSASNGKIYVAASNGPTFNSTTYPFSGHNPGGNYQYEVPAVNSKFVEITIDRAGQRFCIRGMIDPNAISGVEGQASQTAAPTGLAALTAAVLAGLSGAALWRRSKGKTAV